jgi:hypothetical protein
MPGKKPSRRFARGEKSFLIFVPFAISFFSKFSFSSFHRTICHFTADYVVEFRREASESGKRKLAYDELGKFREIKLLCKAIANGTTRRREKVLENHIQHRC